MSGVDRHVGPGTVGVVFFRPGGDIKGGGTLGFVFTRIGVDYPPCSILSITFYFVLVRVQSVGLMGTINVFTRISQCPIRGSPGALLVTLVGGVRGVVQTTMATYGEMVAYSLVTPKDIRQVLG